MPIKNVKRTPPFLPDRAILEGAEWEEIPAEAVTKFLEDVGHIVFMRSTNLGRRIWHGESFFTELVADGDLTPAFRDYLLEYEDLLTGVNTRELARQFSLWAAATGVYDWGKMVVGGQAVRLEISDIPPEPPKPVEGFVRAEVVQFDWDDEGLTKGTVHRKN